MLSHHLQVADTKIYFKHTAIKIGHIEHAHVVISIEQNFTGLDSNNIHKYNDGEAVIVTQFVNMVKNYTCLCCN